MIIKGFQKVSLLDFPGKISAIVFTAGCNFRCPYCYNRDLVLGGEGLPTIPEADIFSYLKKRRKLLDGVVITGGEPSLQIDLSRFLSRCKRMGLATKLDTNGSNTTALHSIVVSGLVDFVALDVKAPLDARCCRVAGVDCDGDVIRRSVEILIQGGIDFELRTTVVPGLHSKKDLVDLAKQLKAVARRPRWYLQQFQPKNCLDPAFEKVKPYDMKYLNEILAAVREYVPGAKLRGV